MGRPNKLSKKEAQYLGGGIAGCIGAVVLIWMFVFGGLAQIQGLYQSAYNPDTTPTTPTTPTTTFGWVVLDGKLQLDITDEVDSSSWEGVLYETDDLDDFLDYNLLYNYTSGVDPEPNDWDDQEEQYLVMCMNGSIDHDDDLFGDDNDFGARVYGIRWFILLPDQVNTIQMYATPSDAGFVAFYSENMTSICFASENVTATDNITLVASTNATETWAAYVGMQSYDIEDDWMVNFLVEFNDTVGIGDFSIRNCAKQRYNTTALVFDFDNNILDSTPVSFLGYWDDDATDLQITNITLRYGDTEL